MRFIKGTFLLELFVAMPGLIIAAALGTATARPDLAGWADLKALAPDQDVRVVLKDGKLCQGNTQLVTPDAMVVRIGGKEQTLAREAILSVRTKGELPRSRNATFGTLFAGAPGAAVGALIPTGRWKEIYRAPQDRTPPRPAP